METEYSSLAELRSELTTDDPDERANAYGAVMENDIQPSQVLGSKPDPTAVETLVEANVIPEQSPASSGRPAAERDEEIVTVLKEIRDAVTGGSA